MGNVINFIIENKAVLIPFVLLGISEAQALKPSWKSNGILDFIIKFLQGENKPKA